jgi:uncharacterized protein (UPF0548 family)
MRETFTGSGVTYGAIGGTLAPDLLQYPPPGTHPTESTVRLGSGDERFRRAAAALMTWGVQRGSGLEVTEVQPGTGVEYRGIIFNEDGTPAAEQVHVTESVLPDDGTEYITNGMTAKLGLPLGPFTVTAPVRVVYVIDEATRIGFAYGTMQGHPVSGEESFIVEHLEDDSVWLTIRAFYRGSEWYHRLAAPLRRRLEDKATKRYLRALHPAAGA